MYEEFLNFSQESGHKRLRRHQTVWNLFILILNFKIHRDKLKTEPQIVWFISCRI